MVATLVEQQPDSNTLRLNEKDDTVEESHRENNEQPLLNAELSPIRNDNDQNNNNLQESEQHHQEQ